MPTQAAKFFEMSLDDLEEHITELSRQRAAILTEARKANMVRDVRIQQEEMRKAAERANLDPEQMEALEATVIRPQTLKVQAELKQAGS